MTERLYGPNNVQEKIKLLTQKGVFPDDNIKTIKVLNETLLPAREEFTNQLKGSECSPADYVHVQNVWNTFKLQNLKQYLKLYLFADVCQLTDVFQDYRKTCREASKLTWLTF